MSEYQTTFLELRRGLIAIRLLMVASAICVQHLAQAADSVNFALEVQPLLQRHCTKCHGPSRQKGGLRLDAREFAQQGGYSGVSLLEAEAESNELLARVKSGDDGYRMPLEGPPLADNEIEILTRWVKAGAPWPEDDPKAERGPDNAEQGLEPWWYSVGDDAKIFSDRFGYAPHILLLLLLVSLVVRRFPSSSLPGWLQALTQTRTQLLVLLCGLLAGVICYAVNVQGELSDAIAANVLSESTELGEPTAYVPLRPGKSISPTYYRGNDERSPKLFNGGFYCTARFDLTVCDHRRQPLNVGDAVGDSPLSIRLQLARPPNTTPKLYAEGIIDRIVLSPVPTDRKVAGLANEIQRLAPIDDQETWVGYFPVQIPPSDAATTTISGVYYLCTGKVTEDVLEGAMHYQVEYNLVIENGVLSDASDLSMGSLLKYKSLQAVEPNKIQQAEWFDFRPIPYVTEQTTTDPALLGIDEHLGDG